jgi:two-component system response regulator HydG
LLEESFWGANRKEEEMGLIQESAPAINCVVSRSVPVKAFRSESGNSTEYRFDALAAKLIGRSLVMNDLRNLVRLVAKANETVLITGESGTGKELIARAIHDLSSRRNNAFVAVNCGALTESLLESELFGHVKGAFTGATTNKKGFFEAASGGTLFLDEFAEMSLATQQRLLRVLQEGTVRPVGSTEPREIKIDTRVLVATHHDVKDDIARGKFRHDLYYRINVLQIESPALRERRGDIVDLAQHFIRNYNDKNAAKVSEVLIADVLRVLESYSWPGNVRELENIIKRLSLNASTQGGITEADLELIPEFRNISEPLTTMTMESPSRKLNCMSGGKVSSYCWCNEQLDQYRRVLKEASGNLAAAARELDMPRTTLRKRLISLQRRCATG